VFFSYSNNALLRKHFAIWKMYFEDADFISSIYFDSHVIILAGHTYGNIFVNSLTTFEIIFLICKLVISNTPAVHDNFTVMIIHVMHKEKHLKGSGRLKFCHQHFFFSILVTYVGCDTVSWHCHHKLTQCIISDIDR